MVRFFMIDSNFEEIGTWIHSFQNVHSFLHLTFFPLVHLKPSAQLERSSFMLRRPTQRVAHGSLVLERLWSMDTVLIASSRRLISLVMRLFMVTR